MNYNTLNVSQRLSCKSKCIVVKNKGNKFYSSSIFSVKAQKHTLYFPVECSWGQPFICMWICWFSQM